MIQISEWLPNPAGNDQGSEWVELYNSGSEPVDLAGWQLKNGKGAVQTLPAGPIPPNSYLVIRTGSKFPLRNSAEELTVVNARGTLIDRSSFSSAAPSGLSYARNGDHFRWLDPTPAAPNPAPAVQEKYIPGAPLAASASAALVISTGFLVALIFAACALYYLKSSHDLQNLFFPRN